MKSYSSTFNMLDEPADLEKRSEIMNELSDLMISKNYSFRRAQSEFNASASRISAIRHGRISQLTLSELEAMKAHAK